MDSRTKSKMSLQAPAKVNLRLKITGRRSDGYHLLDMVMVKLDLADKIDLELGGKGIRFESDSGSVPKDRSNSAWRAAERVMEIAGLPTGLTIRLSKKTPVAAGLGGGSSDAASVLMGLNEWLHLGWSRERLIEIGISLGSDIPFFLVEGPQKVGGIGEQLTPVEQPSLHLILVNPGFPILTADVYRWYDERGSNPPNPPLSNGDTGGFSSQESGLTQSFTDASPLTLENDLEKVVLPRYPVLTEIKNLLVSVGALGSLLSGSGATVFGVFKSLESRDRGYKMLLQKQDPRWWMCRASTLI